MLLFFGTLLVQSLSMLERSVSKFTYYDILVGLSGDI
jgi:hypothetical protein